MGMGALSELPNALEKSFGGHQLTKTSENMWKSANHVVLAPTAPNQRVHVDLFGPLKTSENRHKFVMVYTDAFTRLCRLTAITDKSAPTVADAIFQWLYLFGIPQSIVSDQGKEFCNELAEHLYRALQILSLIHI